MSAFVIVCADEGDLGGFFEDGFRVEVMKVRQGRRL